MDKLKKGDKVTRGPDWNYDEFYCKDVDGGPGGVGTVVIADNGDGTCHVKWDAGETWWYDYNEDRQRIIPAPQAEPTEWISTSGYFTITLIEKEDTMNKNIVEVYENTKDAVLVNEHFGNEIHPTFTGLLNLKANKKAYLEEATRLEEEKKKKD